MPVNKTPPASARARSPTKHNEGQNQGGDSNKDKDKKNDIKDDKKDIVSYDVFLAEGIACMRTEFYERGLGLLDKVCYYIVDNRYFA